MHRRREFITMLGGAAAWPLAGHAQQSGKVWRIAFIAHRYETFYDALFQGLRELGYIEGKTSSSSAGMLRAGSSDSMNSPPRWCD
jgi:hypothetical protein